VGHAWLVKNSLYDCALIVIMIINPYQKFLSSGFAELNANSERHMVAMYRHNYKKFLPENKQARILEIGCGMGNFLLFLGEEGYENFLGVDIAPEAIRYCLDKGISKVKFIKDLMEFLSTAPQFDLIVLNDVIEHLPKNEIVDIFCKISEKLTANGQVIIKTGNMSSMVGLRIRYNDFTHTAGFTEYSLKQTLFFAGFKRTEVRPFVFPKNSLPRLIRFVAQKIAHAAWRFVFFVEYTQVPEIVDELIFAVARK